MSRFIKLAAALSLVAVLASTVAATTASGRSQAGFTLRIGVVVPFTGASAVRSAYAKSAGLAVQQANRALRQAGVNDVKLQIEYADDATTPEGGVNAARAHHKGRRLHPRRADVGVSPHRRPRPFPPAFRRSGRTTRARPLPTWPTTVTTSARCRRTPCRRPSWRA